MNRKEACKKARLSIAFEAGERWRRRAPERAGAQERYVEGGPLKADTPVRTREFAERETRRLQRRAFEAAAGFPMTKERMIGPTLDFSSFAPDEEARNAGRPVARIVEMPEPNIIPEGFGSGFLVCPGMLITNHHVLPTLAEAKGVGANFLHEFGSAGLQRGPVFELDPDTFYVSDERLDFAVVAVKPKAEDGTDLGALNFLSLIRATGKILVGHPVSIIQHPSGGPKQYATTQNKLLDVLDEGFIHYSTDTLRGSSGSPAFNQYWETIGLHHEGIPLIQHGKLIAKNGQPWEPETMSEDEILWIANEGVRVSSIVKFLSELKFSSPQKNSLLATLLRGTGDPLLSGGGGPLGNTSLTQSITKETSMGNVVINVAGNATMYINQQEPAAQRPVVDIAPPPSQLPPAVEKLIRFDKVYKNRAGYDEDFLGVKIPLPGVADTRKQELLDGANGKPLVLKYHHFSLVMNRVRRLLMWSAVNVDYSSDRRSDRSRDDFGDDKWIADPRIPGELQIQDEDFYKPATKIDRGHIVRRDDNCWGDTELEQEYSNSDTFHWTNCTPQHESFNQEKKRGLWGKFETHITKEIGAVDNRASIFAGPVLDNAKDPKRDYGHGEIQYPLRFWKVIAAVSQDDGQLSAYGFVLDQIGPIDKFGLEAMNFAPYKKYQASLAEISKLTGVKFPQVLLDADVLGGSGPQSHEVKDLSDVHLRRATTSAATRRGADSVAGGRRGGRRR